jgi:hypothetical protein
MNQSIRFPIIKSRESVSISNRDVTVANTLQQHQRGLL